MGASLTGMGGVWRNKVYTSNMDVIERRERFTLVHYEAFNVLLAIRLWGPLFKGKSVLVWCHNWAIVRILSSGKGSEPTLLAVARNIWLELARFDVELVIQHSSGHRNVVADLLSGWSRELDAASQLQGLVQHPEWFYPQK